MANKPIEDLTLTEQTTFRTEIGATDAANLTSGTLPDARFPATLPIASAVNLTGLNATNLSSGTVPDARFPATLPAASGVNITALNASNLTTGTVAVGRLATSGTASSTTYLAGDGTWKAPAGNASISSGPLLGATAARIALENQENLVPPQLSVMSMGDSWAIELGGEIEALANKQGNGGLGGQDHFPSAVPNWVVGDSTKSFGSMTVLNATQTVTTMTPTYWMTRANIFYIMENGAGNFRVEQQIGTVGAWTDLTTGQATAASPVVCNNGGAVDCGVLSINWSSTGTDTRRLRITWITGTGNVGIVASNFTATPAIGSSLSNGGVDLFSCAIGGLTVANQSETPQNLYNALFGTLRPHIITYKNDDGAASMAGVSTIRSKVTEATKYDMTSIALGNPTGAGTLTLALSMDHIQVDETPINDDAMVQGRAYKIYTVGTTDYTTWGSADNTVGTIFVKTAGSVGAVYGSGTVYKMSGSNDARIVTYSVAGAMYGPALATAVKAALDAVPNFTDNYTAKVQHDRVLVKGVVAGRKGYLNVGVTGLSGVGMPNATLSDYRRACKPDWVLVSSHPTNGSQANTLSAADEVLKAQAESARGIFVDCRTSFPSYADMIGSYNFMQDGYHLGATTGKDFESKLVMDRIGEVLKSGSFGNLNFSSGRGPAYKVGQIGAIAAPSGNSAFLDVRTIYNASAHKTSIFGLYRQTDDSIAVVVGPNYTRVKLGAGSQTLMVLGGTGGGGFPQNNSARLPVGVVEVHGVNQNLPLITASGYLGFTEDAFRVTRDASISAGVTGTRMAGIKTNGAADFVSVRTATTSVANLAALVNITSGSTVGDETMAVGSYYRIVSVGDTNFTTFGAAASAEGVVFLKNSTTTPYGSGTVVLMVVAAGTESYVTDGSVAHAGNSGTVVAGGGANFLPVYYDGTNWRIR